MVQAIIAYVLLFIFFFIKFYSPNIKGWIGEKKVEKEINKIRNTKILNNITLKIDGKTTQIDHIIISNYKIYVIETKNYSGRIQGGLKFKQWIQYIYGAKFKFMNPHNQNYKHIQFLKNYIKDQKIISLVCFVNDNKFVGDKPDNTYNLKELIDFINKDIIDCDIKNIKKIDKDDIYDTIENYMMEKGLETNIEHCQNIDKNFFFNFAIKIIILIVVPFLFSLLILKIL